MRSVGKFLVLYLIISSTNMAWADGCNEQRSQYVVQAETVYDTKSNLTWARCSVGQEWKEGFGCVGDLKWIEWNEASRLQKGVWRLPTVVELQTLVIDRCPKGAKFNTEVFPNVAYNPGLIYWSSEQYGSYDTHQLVSLHSGRVGADGGKHLVRMVRAGK